MSPPEWHAEAKRLRAEGLVWREIGERLGKPMSTVRAAVDPRQRRRAYKNAWHREHYRGVCETCGGPTSWQHTPRCWSCEVERRREQAA